MKHVDPVHTEQYAEATAREARLSIAADPVEKSMKGFDDFLSSRVKRRKTARGYVACARVWAAWWKKDVSLFTVRDLEAFHTHLDQEGYAKSNQRIFLTAIRSYRAFVTGNSDYFGAVGRRVSKGPRPPDSEARAQLRKLTEEYLGGLLVQGHSPVNVDSYRRYLDRFLDHLEAEGRDIFSQERRGPKSVDHGCLLRWLQAIRLTGVKEYSLQANKTAVSSLYRWMIRIGHIERNPIEMMAPIKLPEKAPRAIAVEDTLKVLDGISRMNWVHGERNRAILELFYASGIRCAELKDLDVSDVALEGESPYVSIREGKGKRDGIGLLTPSAVEAIKAYLPFREKILRRWERPSNWAPLFLSKSGRRLDSPTIWSIVGDIGEKILGRHIHPHQFRHSFCTDLLNRGVDLMSIKELARHKNLATTQRYLSISRERLKAAYLMHPGHQKREAK